jgi:hypothetical protein
VHSVAQNPAETLSKAEKIFHDKIRSHILTAMANEGTEVDPAEVNRRIRIEELSGKVWITSTNFNVLVLTKTQNYVIGKEEVKNSIEYVWDKGLHGMKNKRLLEGLYLACKLPESSIARREKLNVSRLSFMH